MVRTTKCALCLAPPNLAVSCSQGRRGTRIPFGSEFHINAIDPATGEPAVKCPVCNCPAGGFHHVECIADECPACQGAAWKCGCVGNRLRVLRSSKGATDQVMVKP